MGSFIGHAIPGTMFIILAFWWMIETFYHFFKSRRRKIRYESNLGSHTCPFLCGRVRDWPIVPVLKVFILWVSIFGEVFTGFDGNGKFIIGNGQHATMYFFFGLVGVGDLLKRSKSVPRDIDYVMHSLAFIVEALLFKFHLHGRDELNTLLHVLLIYTIVGAIIVLFVEMRWRHNVLTALSRTFFLFLQGTWFWQIGFVLYSPCTNPWKWEHSSHDSLSITTMVFAWHCGAVFTFMCISGTLIHYCLRRTEYGEVDVRKGLHNRLLHPDRSEQAFISLQGELEESDE